MTVQRSTIKHSGVLTELAKASKKYWNYPEKYLAIWDDDLTVSAAYIEANHVFHLESDSGEIVGFYSFFNEAEMMSLEHLFILPKFIGQKLGTMLMEDFLEKAEKSGCQKIILDAEPNAEAFYKKFGFQTVELKSSAIKDRTLPVMIKKIN